MPTGTFVYTGAGKKLNDGETDPCLINKTCRRLACDIQWCRELYLGADVHRQHTDVHVAHTEYTRGGTELWPRRVCSPTSVRRSTQPCLFHTLFWLPITTTPSILGPGPLALTRSPWFAPSSLITPRSRSQ